METERELSRYRLEQAKEYIKTGKLDISLSDIISDLFQIRTESDYDDYYVISRAEVQEQIQNASYFLEQTQKFLMDNVH